MAKLTLEINLGNEAMQVGRDVAAALQKVAAHLREYSASELNGASGRVRDLNGNTVGSWTVEEE